MNATSLKTLAGWWLLVWLACASVYALPSHIWRSVPLDRIEEAREAMPGLYRVYKTLTGLSP